MTGYGKRIKNNAGRHSHPGVEFQFVKLLDAANLEAGFRIQRASDPRGVKVDIWTPDKF